jgi:hypothetical protein
MSGLLNQVMLTTETVVNHNNHTNNNGLYGRQQNKKFNINSDMSEDSLCGIEEYIERNKFRGAQDY